MKEITITIVVPSYKPGPYMQECLDSLCNQTLPHESYEILIVLNGCDQPYKETIDTYIAQHPDAIIRLIHTSESGVSKSRNIGIDNAKGEYIAFVDDDDVVSSTYLERLLAVSSPDCIGCSNCRAFLDDLQSSSECFVTKAYKKVAGKRYSQTRYRKYLSPSWAKLIHRDIIGDSRFSTKLRFSEDSVFCMDILPRIKDMKTTTEDAIYYVRNRRDSISRKSFSITTELRQFINIEIMYISTWWKNKSKTSPLLLCTRMVAAVWNIVLRLRGYRL